MASALIPLGILAGGSLISMQAGSTAARRQVATNVRKANNFITPHKRAHAGESFSGIEGSQLTQAEINRFEAMAQTDVNAAIQWAAGRQDRRVIESKYRKTDARAQELHEQRIAAGETSQAINLLNLQNAELAEQRRTALEASRTGPKAAQEEAARQGLPTYQFPDPDRDGILITAPQPSNPAFISTTETQSDLTEFLRLTNEYSDLVKAGVASLSKQDPRRRTLEAVTSRLQVLYKGKLLDTNLGANIAGAEALFLTGGVEDANELSNLAFSNPDAVLAIMANTQEVAMRELTNVSKRTRLWVGNEDQAKRTLDELLRAQGHLSNNQQVLEAAQRTGVPPAQAATGLTPIDDMILAAMGDPNAQRRVDAIEAESAERDELVPLVNTQAFLDAASGAGGAIASNPAASAGGVGGGFALWAIARRFLGK